MKPTFEDFEREVVELQGQITKSYKKYETDDRGLISDGIVNLREYYDSDLKIMWILKEPYDEGDNTGGWWSLTNAIGKEPNKFVLGGSRSTWQPIVYATYGIHNNVLNYSDMGYIRNNHEMMNILKKIAFINIQKMPAGTRTYYNNIQSAYKSNKEILLTQIKTYNPDIIIGGSVMYLFSGDLDFRKEKMGATDSNEYWIQNGKLFIAAYHPAQTTTTRDVYVDDLLFAVRKYKESCKTI